jgi:ATP-dependent RNA helicase RhlE
LQLLRKQSRCLQYVYKKGKMKFEDYNLAPELANGISKLGFKRPTDIQYKTIPSILKGEDVLAVAQTGTGKTAAFAIPIIHLLHQNRLSERRQDGLKCIIMVPTHELAIQITEVIQELAKETRVKVMGIYGGVDQDPQIAALANRVDIVVATPGRLFDLISQGHLIIHRVNTLVLDEADHMLDLGFIKDIEDLNKKLPQQRQTLFFSATINHKIKKIAYSLIRQNAIRIQISPRDPVSKNVNHAVAFMEMDAKRFFLEQVINENPDMKILVFVRTKVRAERVKSAMERAKIVAETIHSDKAQSDRDEVMQNFRDGKVKILIATDITARGIDIPDVQMVINYDLPEKAEYYVHRIGRTGRGKKRGEAISFCSPSEKECLEEIETFTSSRIMVLEVSKHAEKEARILSNTNDKRLDMLLQQIEENENRNRKRKKRSK